MAGWAYNNARLLPSERIRYPWCRNRRGDVYQSDSIWHPAAQNPKRKWKFRDLGTSGNMTIHTTRFKTVVKLIVAIDRQLCRPTKPSVSWCRVDVGRWPARSRTYHWMWAREPPTLYCSRQTSCAPCYRLLEHSTMNKELIWRGLEFLHYEKLQFWIW